MTSKFITATESWCFVPHKKALQTDLSKASRLAAEGSYGSGPLIVLMAPDAEPPYALVNRGAGNSMLAPKQPIAFPMCQCEAGEQFMSEWIART